MRFEPWARLFRAPNLATAGGDAMAGGAAFCLALASAADPGVQIPTVRFVAAVVAAAAAELFLYMAGLADNDLVDEEADRKYGKSRPLADGSLCRSAVKRARTACFALAAAAGLAMRPSPWWWGPFAALVFAILGYNRVKESHPRLGFSLMGLCRALGVALGAAAAVSNITMPGEHDFNAQDGLLFSATFAIMLFFATWSYVAQITKIGAGEEQSAKPLSWGRYLTALAPMFPMLLPVSLIVQFLIFPIPGTMFRNYAPLLVPVMCAAVGSVSWIAAVRPLGRQHTTADRGRAVGRAIGGLLWMQTSLLVFGVVGIRTALAMFPLYAIVCHVLRCALRRIPAS